MNILIIEDEAAIREFLRELLEMKGHTVLDAPDGLAGLTLAASHPDLILCDINMPELDGYGVLEALQKNPALRDIPFVFLTAVADRSSQRRGMEVGACDFITKPFTEDEIIKVIAAAVRRQQPLRERVASLLIERNREVAADWAHELMTPLNGMLGGLALIESEAETIKPGELKELLAIIRTSAERQLALSTKLVRYYELEHAKTNPPATPSVCDAPAHIAAGAKEAAGTVQRDTDLFQSCAPGGVQVQGSHLAAAISELVTNAFLFSKPGQPVALSGTNCDGRYRIEIVDQGVGMTSEQCTAAAAFKQFARKQHSQQGLGLGLAIARSVAEVAGGRLILQPGPGARGLQATLDLPCA